MPKIIGIETTLPAYRYAQSTLRDRVIELTAPKDSRLFQAVFNRSSIEHRYSVLPDFTVDSDQHTLFSTEKVMGLDARQKVFEKESVILSTESSINLLNRLEIEPKEITHLITVSCTGLTAPGLDVLLIEQLGLNDDIVRIGVNFMGCHAAFQALRMAGLFTQTMPTAKVLVVSVELCSLHFQPDISEDYIIANALFGDGCASCVVVDDSVDKPGLVLEEMYTKQLRKTSSKEMAWKVSEKGFLMKLSAYLPQILEANLKEELQSFFIESFRETVDTWCVHPGGKNILQAVAKSFSLPLDQLHDSFETLRNYGNMSSATILFVLKRLFDNPQEQTVAMMGLGPGITVEACKARYVV